MAKAELYIKNGSSWVNYNLLNAYPVGAIYASGSSTSPASLFGGSWTQITNAALRGATNVGYTGSDSHTLSANEMPKHRHNFRHNAIDGPVSEDVVVGEASTTTGGGSSFWTVSGTIFRTSIDYTGGGQHIPTCNAPTTVTSGNAQAKSPRGDVAWHTSI